MTQTERLAELRELFQSAPEAAATRVVALVASLVLVSVVLWLVRRRSLREEYTPIWISVAAGIRVPRYALWLELHDLGWNPDAMTTEQALAFVDGAMQSFLGQRGLAVTPRAFRRLRKLIVRFNPDHPTPYEHFERWGRAR